MVVTTLKKNREFGYVYRRGKTVPKRDFSLIYVKSKYGGVRAGFSVSKKVGNSVQRNRARRRLKEAMGRLLPQTRGNYSIVLVARPHITEAAFASLVEQLQDALTKAGIAGKSRHEEDTDRSDPLLSAGNIASF